MSSIIGVALGLATGWFVMDIAQTTKDRVILFSICAASIIHGMLIGGDVYSKVVLP